MMQLCRRSFSTQTVNPRRIAASIEEAARNTSDISDFRSDTVTKPCKVMRDAMAHAVAGDDVYNDCPTTKALQRQIAEMFGKEDALFVPTGTMSNIVSTMVMTKTAACSFIIGDLSHYANYERGGMATLVGAFPICLPNEPDGTIPISRIERALSVVKDNHISTIAGMSLESSHNMCNGRVLHTEYISQVKKVLKKKKLRLHLDGARCWNAAVHLGVDMKTYTKDFDLVSACLSKGMGCPQGSLVIGTHDDIQEARNWRKMLGGGMRQTGIVAATAFVALQDW